MKSGVIQHSISGRTSDCGTESAGSNPALRKVKTKVFTTNSKSNSFHILVLHNNLAVY